WRFPIWMQMMSNVASVLDTEDQDLEREPSGATPRSYIARFVWGFWEIFFVLALAFVYLFGSRIPLMEDWDFIDFLTGRIPLTFNSLWVQGWSDHRVPLPALVTIGALKLFGPNLFPLLYLQVLLCGLLAAGLIWAAKQVRGWTDYADAFFPVLLLH